MVVSSTKPSTRPDYWHPRPIEAIVKSLSLFVIALCRDGLDGDVDVVLYRTHGLPKARLYTIVAHVLPTLKLDYSGCLQNK